MNRRHVLQTLAVLSAGSTIVAFGESSSARLTLANPRDLCGTLRESRALCINLLSRLDRVESRVELFAGMNSAATHAATQTLKELVVLLEQAEVRVSGTELNTVALLQACVDSFLRVEKPLNSLCQEAILPRPVVDCSIAVFGQARQLLLSRRAA